MADRACTDARGAAAAGLRGHNENSAAHPHASREAKGAVSGRGGIRTPETGVARLTVFKTVAFNRSATLPRAFRCYAFARAGPADRYAPLEARETGSTLWPSDPRERWPSG